MRCLVPDNNEDDDSRSYGEDSDAAYDTANDGANRGATTAATANTNITSGAGTGRW